MRGGGGTVPNRALIETSKNTADSASAFNCVYVDDLDRKYVFLFKATFILEHKAISAGSDQVQWFLQKNFT